MNQQTRDRQPTNERELRRQLWGRRIHVAVPVGGTSEPVRVSFDEAVRLWCLAHERGSPVRIHLDDDDLETIDLAVLDFSDPPATGAERA